MKEVIKIHTDDIDRVCVIDRSESIGDDAGVVTPVEGRHQIDDPQTKDTDCLVLQQQQTRSPSDRQTGGRTDRHKERQTDSQIYREIDRYTVANAYTYMSCINTYTPSCVQSYMHL